MHYKRIQGHGIIVDAIMICFDFAAKMGIDKTQIINELLLRISLGMSDKDSNYFFKLWNESEKMNRKEQK